MFLHYVPYISPSKPHSSDSFFLSKQENKPRDRKIIGVQSKEHQPRVLSEETYVQHLKEQWVQKSIVSMMTAINRIDANTLKLGKRRLIYCIYSFYLILKVVKIIFTVFLSCKSTTCSHRYI